MTRRPSPATAVRQRAARPAWRVLAAAALTLVAMAAPASATTTPTSALARAKLPTNALTSEQAATLNAVSCPGLNDCVAVGSFRTSKGFQLLADTETDGQWAQPADLALPSGAVASTSSGTHTTELLGVSCPALAECVAVGTVLTSSGFVPVVDADSGGAWSATTVSLPTGAVTTGQVADLDAISCVAPGDCEAVGTYLVANDTIGSYEPLAIEERSGVWQAARSPALPSDALTAAEGQDAGLLGVSCVASGQCVAVGTYQGSNGSEPVVLSESGGAWGAASTARSVAPPAGAVSSAAWMTGFDAVDCPSASSCVAVGQYETSTGYDAMTAQIADGAWTAGAVATPTTSAPGTPVASLESVNCADATDCLAVGTSGTNEETAPLEFALVGGTWQTATSGPLPSDASTSSPGQLADYSAASCFAPGDCLAVGTYVTANGTEGLTSTPTTVPGPPVAVAAAAGNASISVSWLAPAYHGLLSLTGYVAQAEPGNLTCTTSTLACTITGLVNGDTYSVSVVAENSLGASASSTSVKSTPVTVPSSPTIVHVKPLTNGFRLILAAPSSNGGTVITTYQYSVDGGHHWIARSDGTTSTVLQINGLSARTRYVLRVRAVNAVGHGPASPAVRTRTL